MWKTTKKMMKKTKMKTKHVVDLVGELPRVGVGASDDPVAPAGHRSGQGLLVEAPRWKVGVSNGVRDGRDSEGLSDRNERNKSRKEKKKTFTGKHERMIMENRLVMENMLMLYQRRRRGKRLQARQTSW